MSRMFKLLLLVFLVGPPTVVWGTNDPRSNGQAPPLGNEDALQDLVARVLPKNVQLTVSISVNDECQPQSESDSCFQVTTVSPTELRVTGTTANDAAAGLGFYLRSACNVTIGWPRGGGSDFSSLLALRSWPDVSLKKNRLAAWSYMMNVCTQSYSLAWYSWNEWEPFIDWMALSGINLVLATTGQEEVQYKVFEKLGLSDIEIRSWFNGPAFLTWSRGQNEYGNDIAGPLPRSWMKEQWNLQKRILERYRGLGIVGQLPGFQGNVPIALKTLHKDSNITQQGDTGWMDSLDPLFAKIADLWMETLIKDFGTQHWYQLDGYFNGGTAPWLSSSLSSSSSSDIVPDQMYFKRGAAAYAGLNRTDPDAIWSFQGWAFISWTTPKQGSYLKGFVDATPPGKFVVIDMSTNGEGEWRKWDNASFFGARYIWTSLHDFGGTDGMKGDLSRVSNVGFFEEGHRGDGFWGTGFTPEGIDQNPVYYDFLVEENWRDRKEEDLIKWATNRAMQRYRPNERAHVAKAWELLVGSAYAQDLSVQDGTGVPKFPASYSEFNDDRFTPGEVLCDIWSAWGEMIQVNASGEPFRYDLVNLGREVLAQISAPASMNFSDALNSGKNIKETAQAYAQVLLDIDELVSTDPAFLLGPWLKMAREGDWTAGSPHDCANDYVSSCEDFYTWNAKVQLTTWNPTPKNATKVPGGPIDYAGKHWSGLIKDYYVERIKRVAADPASKDLIEANLAFEWTTDFKTVYPEEPVGDFIAVSKAMHAKYSHFFSGKC